jgi:predicted DNA-binding transcriptional regulator AlpA
MLPDLVTPIEARAIRAVEAARLLGLSRSAFYLQLKNPKFPQGCKLGRARVWLPTDLFNWIQQKSRSGGAR